MAIGARTQETGVSAVIFGGPITEVLDDFVFGKARRQIQRAFQQDLVRQVRKQRFTGIRSDGLEHLAALGTRFRQIPQTTFLLLYTIDTRRRSLVPREVSR